MNDSSKLTALNYKLLEKHRGKSLLPTIKQRVLDMTTNLINLYFIKIIYFCFAKDLRE